MTSTPIDLGALLDGWATAGQVGLVETALAVTVSRLDRASTLALLTAVGRLGWSCEVQDQAGEPTHANRLEQEFGPFVATIRKTVDKSARRFLTRIGIAQGLAEKAAGGIWQIACSQVSFTTGTTSFNPWGSGDVFAPASATKSPLDIVREASEARLVPADIRKWLLRGEVTTKLWGDPAFQTFAAASAAALVRSVASEVVGPGGVIFNGPPRLNISLPDDGLVHQLDLSGYRNLQACVAWIYEDSKSAEQRHALFAAEFARSVTRDVLIGEAFRAAGRDILDGARLAFQLSQSELSREAIKAQGDLRKAIADDTSKAAEGTRTLSGAIAVTIATGITLIAAKSAGTVEPWVLSVVAGVAAAYLVIVAFSGWAYLKLQRDLRDQWRRRFYRFVSAEDYEAMVIKPARSAELPYHFVAAIALVVAVALGWLARTAWLEPPPKSTIEATTIDDTQKAARKLNRATAPKADSPLPDHSKDEPTR